MTHREHNLSICDTPDQRRQTAKLRLTFSFHVYDMTSSITRHTPSVDSKSTFWIFLYAMSMINEGEVNGDPTTDLHDTNSKDNENPICLTSPQPQQS